MENREVKRAITDRCVELQKLLVAKNAAYGNSALDPVRVFSTASPLEQLKVRLDDKLSRLARGGAALAAAGESYRDTVLDTAGYLVLLLIALDDEKKAGG